jgi:hypothetical protein
LFTSYPPTPEARERTLRVRLSESELATLAERAALVALPLSTYARCAVLASDASRKARVRLPGAAAGFLVGMDVTDMEPGVA